MGNAEIRPGTDDELGELNTYDRERWGWSESEDPPIYSTDSIIVIPNYITGGPGYAGPVFIVLWDAGPEATELFTRDYSRDERGQTWAGKLLPVALGDF